MEDRIARALNRLGEDADLLSADTDGLLELLDDYLDDDDPLGKTPPSTHLKIQYYITTTTTTQHHTLISGFNNNNSTLVASDKGMDGVEDPLEEIHELEESNSPSAEEIVSAGLESGSPHRHLRCVSNHAIHRY